MDDYEKYEQLRIFIGGPLWKEVLKPRLAAWAQQKQDAMASAKTPADLWDARTRATTAAEALPLIDNAFEELRRQINEQAPHRV